MLRGAHLSSQAPGASAGAVAAGLLPCTVLGHGHGLPKGRAGGACAPAAWPSPCASSGRIWLQKSQVLGPPSFPSEDSLVQPRGLLCSTPGSSLGPPAARASFPASAARPGVPAPSSPARARASRACGSAAPGSALPPRVLPRFPPGPAQPPPRRGSPPGLPPSSSYPRPTSSPRVAIFSKSSARRHQLGSHSSQPRAAALPSSSPSAATAAAVARPEPRAARTEPVPPLPPLPPRSPPSPPPAPAAAAKSLLAEQRRSLSQLSIPSWFLLRHSLLLERWLFGEEVEVRGSPERDERGRDRLSRSGRR